MGGPSSAPLVWRARQTSQSGKPPLHAVHEWVMPTERAAPPGRKRILIVEDHELNMKLLNDLLEAHGYDILLARDGTTALRLARQQAPDLILMDIQLPDISGLEATRLLKADRETSAIPIVAVTAFAMAGDRERTLESGCDAYVAKPIMIREFLALIEQMVGSGEHPDSRPV